MTEYEAIEELKDENEHCYDQCEGCCSEVEENVCTCRDAIILSVLEQYRAIGTVEECREAMGRQRAKKPIILSEQSAESEGKLYIAKYFKCPTCGNTSTYFGGLPNNCHNCGQSLESDTPMTYQIADQRHPFMGLDNKICENPSYWCRLHQVWLSEDDVKKKQCECKQTFDMVGTYRCGNLAKKTMN